MLTQAEFAEILASLPPPPPPGPVRCGQIVTFTLSLAKALRRQAVSPALWNMLVSVARQQQARGWASRPAIALDLGCTFQAIDQQLLKSDHLFAVDRSTHPARLTLSAEAVGVLRDTIRLAKRYSHD